MNRSAPTSTAAPPRDDMLERAVAVLASVGDDFLPAVAAELARALDAELALVGEILDDGQVRTMAVSRDGRAGENFTYVPRLPAASVVPGVFLCHPGDACCWLPDRPRVRREAACAGVVLADSCGAPIGVLLVTLAAGTDAREAVSRLMLFAARVAGEMQRTRTERELRRHDEHLLQVQRVEAVGRLAGGVAHDFNNLLMIVIGYAELLKERYGTSPEAVELLAAATRATTLTRQLLAFGRRQVLQAERLDLNRLVAQVQAMLAPVIGAHVSIDTDLADDLPSVDADPGQMEQVIVNLALNARDAMPDGGAIRIETRLAEVREDYHQMPRGSYVCLAIADSGIGMSSDVQRHIFEPFYTTKGAAGTGLGLSSVYGIIKQSGGYIWCTSAPGAGTTFRIYLKPAAAAPAAGDGAGDANALRGPLAAGHVLVVDDEPGVRKLLSRVLAAQGFTVSEAADAQEALANLERAMPRVDLVVSDMVMPAMDGLALAAAVSNRWPETKVLLMSGYAQGGVRQGTAIPPQLPLLPKPFTAQQLTRTVRTLLDG